TSEAVRFIKEKKKEPFFLYVPFTAVHTPFDEPPKWLGRVDNIDPERRQYVACAEHMDDGIGQILRALDEEGKAENTLVIFFSDNGGTNGDDSSRYPDTKAKGKIKGLNTPLRGWKTQVYEGGIRVPAIAYWPGKLKPAKLSTPTHVVDWMPTICAVAGCKFDKDPKWDGIDIWPLLNGKGKKDPERILYCKGVNGTSSALHRWPWKLIKGKDKVQLYNLNLDPTEKEDLSKKQPDKVKELLKTLELQASKDNASLP
ncbi:MAG: sulfatase-like hydrolase/transferase, partial [Akkermansiaceae bacterium]|nr:sulfatase-like hydrolase/transferase [Akkermansiaceae bacterium]